MLENYANATVVGGIEKYDITNKNEKEIELTEDKVNSVLGSNISEEEILNIFERLDFKAEVKDGKIIVTVPTRRLDISIPEDLIEEVGRIYGVDNIEGRQMLMKVKKRLL